MEYQLRDYQAAMVEEFVHAKRTHRRIVISVATGSGKTVIALHGILPHLERPVVWVTHRVELMDQVRAYGLDGLRVVMAQSRDMERIRGCKSVIVDEGHHVTASSYQRILGMNPSAMVVCLTATPYRTDGVGLGRSGFTKMIIGPDMYRLTQAGWLAPAVVLVPESESTIPWVAEAAAGKIADSEFKRVLVYATSVSEGLALSRALNRRGVRSEMVHGEMDKDARRKAVGAFRRGKLRGLVNYGIFTEGNDIPEVDAVVMNRHTSSRTLWKQMAGRGLRPAAGKWRCVIFDLAGNGIVHGSLYDREILGLDGSVIRLESQGEEEMELFECESERQLSLGENLKLWKPKRNVVLLHKSLQAARSISPLRRLRTGYPG